MNSYIQRMMQYFMFFFLFLSSIIAQSQSSPTKFNLWTRYAVSYSFTEKFRFETEFQYRRQNETEGTTNPIAADLLKTIRFTGTYKINSNLQLSFSPYAYFRQYAPIYTEADRNKIPKNENRFSIGLESSSKLNAMFSYSSRGVVEYRDVIDGDDVIRLRARFMIKYNLYKNLFFNIHNELFTNIKGTDKRAFFDQNRLGIYLNYNPITKFRIEMGYMSVLRFNKNTYLEQIDDNIIAHFYYQIN